MPALYRELGQILSFRGIRPVHEPSYSSHGPGGLMNERLIDTRKNITDVIGSWACLVAEEKKLSAAVRNTRSIDGLSVFLLRHLQWLSAHPAAADFVHEIDAVYSDGRSHHRVPGIHDLGNQACEAPGCGARLRIVTRTEGSQGPLVLRCDEGHSWKAEQWLELGAKNHCPGQRVSTRVAAVAVGVSESTIRQWVRRGKLTRYGTDGKAEFDLSELAALSRQR
jgi:hypothetical protein